MYVFALFWNIHELVTRHVASYADVKHEYNIISWLNLSQYEVVLNLKALPNADSARMASCKLALIKCILILCILQLVCMTSLLILTQSSGDSEIEITGKSLLHLQAKVKWEPMLQLTDTDKQHGIRDQRITAHGKLVAIC